MGFCFKEMSVQEIYKVFEKHPFICTDSRKIVKDALFFALKGNSFDGNAFAEVAISEGCSFAVVDDPGVVSNDRFLLVANVLESLQQLAAFHRTRFPVPVLAITGSNGKTTTKELCYAVLSERYRTIATQGNLNNHIGVPLTILSVTGYTDIAIIEMGASHPGEISLLCQIARPNLGIITNIGRAHLEGFGSIEGIARAKNELYSYIGNTGGTLFVNADNELLMSLSDSVPRIMYGTGSSSSIRGTCTSMDPYLTVRITDSGSDQERIIQTRLTGTYNLENILAACAVGNYFHVDSEKIARAISGYRPANMRSQVLETEHNRIILDAYNANPSSMEAALKNFAELSDPDKWIIIGDMLELGSGSVEEHQQIIDIALQLGLRNGILIGKHFASLAAPAGFRIFRDISEAREYLTKHPIRKSTLLVKGSRAMGLEKLVDLF